MANNFVFIGNPGSDAREKLTVLEEIGATARRVPETNDVDSIVALTPRTIVLSADMSDLGQFIVSLRERRELSRVPIIARLPQLSHPMVEHAFRSGCEDIIIDGKLNQFRAMAAVVTQNEDWQSMRAPAGLVVLAHQDRYTRMRIGQVLRKNGFDLHFAGSTEELVDVVETHCPRAVITAANLPPRTPVTYFGTLEHSCPWIALTPPHQMTILEKAIGDTEGIKLLDESSDAESLTFVLNDFLAPKQKSERRTPRILYGTPVVFCPRGGDWEEAFYGFSYNVNIGGLFVRTLTPPPMQSLLSVKFTPPMGQGCVVITAQVVWRKEIGSTEGPATPEGMGVQFVDAMPADLAGFETGYNMMRDNDDHRKAAYTSIAPEQKYSSMILPR